MVFLGYLKNRYFGKVKKILVSENMQSMYKG